ncbi:MAG: bifunctional 23S rRNA (guanine(2069)-N(7))-methyltransferase RlmK/23S rRNA (guanine(2445)-N(2))-methyltransferase RlmL [Chromatiales bacterium]|nr:bifunctional 23S rRNA (guanine(2069)-N(7))-methyltransferase RlmK/23S rRNA (guanine(2445)-N(2))-methyltransferase RlmL [Chromatiales bacterium]
MKFYASAARGLAPLLANELHQLGARKIVPGEAGVSFEGELEHAYRLCLWSRVASRVLLPLTTVPIRDADQLYNEAKAIRWERHLHSRNSFAVEVKGSSSSIGHSKYAGLKLKDAIVDRFRERFDERPSVELDTPDVRIHLHLRGERARISIDLSGSSLHQRRYRVEGVIAPLKENLAAALLLEAGWPAIARNGGGLIDPMCGSGTLLIEAAMIAADIAPGLGRDYFGFLGWRRHDAALWQELLDEAQARREAGLVSLPALHGYDHNPEAVRASQANLAQAGLSELIRVQQLDLMQALPEAPCEQGLLMVNPPYGERLGELNALRPLYARLGQLMREHLPHWQLAVFTGNPELAQQIALPPRRPIPLQNGPLACQLLRYEAVGEVVDEAASKASHQDLPTDQATGSPLQHSEGAQMFANRLRKNLKKLGKWARREAVSCYRLYDADMPEYALAIDLYRSKQDWLHVQEYQAPSSIEPERAAIRLQEAMAILPETLGIPPERIVLKVRKRQKGKEQYEKLADSKHFIEVQEGPCRLLVNLSDYLDTGLFLDHRPTRLMIGQLARRTRFLNLFAYTGAATVHAALGGATTTTTVDMSHTYLDWARRNMSLNEQQGNQHRYIQADCTEWLASQARGVGRGRYDLIFLDPPTFSSSKRMQDSFDVQRDHPALIRDAMALLASNGTLIFSNNFRRFRLDPALEDEFATEEISRQTLPEDFARNPHIHRCWRITHQVMG